MIYLNSIQCTKRILLLSEFLQKVTLSILISLLFPPQSYSKNFSELKNYTGETSDRIKVSSNDLTYETNKTDLFWPYADLPQSNYSLGLKYARYDLSGPQLSFHSHSFKVTGSKQLNQQQKLSLNLGIQRLQYQTERDYLIGGIDYQNQWSQNFNFNISIDRQFLFPSVVALNNDPKKLYASMIQSALNWKVFESYDLQLKNRFNFIDDNNQSRYTDFQMMYAFSRFPHWFRLGLGGELFGYQRTTTAYWSPRQFSNWGPRLDLSYSLLDKLQYFLGGSYNFFRENDFKPGQGFYGRTGLQLGDRNHFLAVIAYEKTQSIQSGRIWHNDALNISLNGFW